MFREPEVKDAAQMVALYAAAGVCSSAFFNALYVMMGLSAWNFHFLQYAVLAFFLAILRAVGLIPIRGIHWREALPLAATQLIVSLATGAIHSKGNEGALYTIRLADGISTGLVLSLGSKFTDATSEPVRERRLLVVLIAVAASLAWFEWDFMETSGIGLLAMPILGVVNGLHFLLTFRTAQRLGCHTDELLLHVSWLTAAFLVVPMLLFTSDAFNKGQIGTMTAWALVDYAAVGLTLIFLTTLTYAKYWLMANAAPETHAVLRHGLFTAAAIGQYFLRGLVYANFLSLTAKAVAVVAIIFYFLRRRK